MPRLTDEQKADLKTKLIAGDKMTKLAKEFGVTWDTVNGYKEDLIKECKIQPKQQPEPRRLSGLDARSILEAIVQTHEEAISADTKIRALNQTIATQTAEMEALRKQKVSLEQEVILLHEKVDTIGNLEKRLELARQQG